MLLIIVIVGCCLLHRKRIIHIPFLDGIIPQETVDNGSGNGGNVTTAELQMHFMQLGNGSDGDSTLIKVGNTEVLIDAGSIRSSASTLVPYIQNYCTDGKLEYVIATHMHEDHIAAFVGTPTIDGIFESFVCETIIEAPKTTIDSKLYQEYVTLRNAENATYYTALDCVDKNGAKLTFDLSENITMRILYQEYYEKATTIENDNSVCVLFTQGDNKYLFTGDLQKNGEESLVACNPDLKNVDLFKAGHHGSDTSNNALLIDKIQPKMVVVNCSAGGSSYNFPTQEVINNVAKYTEQVYVTTMATENGWANMNGNIIVSSDGGELSVTCSNNNTLLKDTDWFKENRICPDKWKTA